MNMKSVFNLLVLITLISVISCTEEQKQPTESLPNLLVTDISPTKCNPNSGEIIDIQVGTKLKWVTQSQQFIETRVDLFIDDAFYGSVPLTLHSSVSNVDNICTNLEIG